MSPTAYASHPVMCVLFLSFKYRGLKFVTEAIRRRSAENKVYQVNVQDTCNDSQGATCKIRCLAKERRHASKRGGSYAVGARRKTRVGHYLQPFITF